MDSEVDLVKLKWFRHDRFGSVGRNRSVPISLITERASNVEGLCREEVATLMECTRSGGMDAWRRT